MKAILEFNLPEDKEYFRMAAKGADLSYIIWELDQKLRALEKYKDQDTISIEEARGLLFEIMEQYDVTFNDEIFN